MERLLGILSEIRPDVDFTNEEELVDGGILDSFDIVSIISEVDNEFGVAIRITELKPENFNSASAIFKLIQELKEKQ